MNRMFAKRKNKKPTHLAHIPMKNREECYLNSAQLNTNKQQYNLELN